MIARITNCSMIATVIVTLLLGSAPVRAENEVDKLNEFVHVETDADNTYYSIRAKDFIGKSRNIPFSIWIEADHSRDASVKARKSMLFTRLNCAAATFRVTNVYSYDSTGSTLPKALYQVHYTDQPAVPGSVIGSLVENACDVLL